MKRYNRARLTSSAATPTFTSTSAVTSTSASPSVSPKRFYAALTTSEKGSLRDVLHGLKARYDDLMVEDSIRLNLVVEKLRAKFDELNVSLPITWSEYKAIEPPNWQSKLVLFFLTDFATVIYEEAKANIFNFNNFTAREAEKAYTQTFGPYKCSQEKFVELLKKHSTHTTGYLDEDFAEIEAAAKKMLPETGPVPFADYIRYKQLATFDKFPTYVDAYYVVFHLVDLTKVPLRVMKPLYDGEMLRALHPDFRAYLKRRYEAAVKATNTFAPASSSSSQSSAVTSSTSSSNPPSWLTASELDASSNWSVDDIRAFCDTPFGQRTVSQTTWEAIRRRCIHKENMQVMDPEQFMYNLTRTKLAATEMTVYVLPYTIHWTTKHKCTAIAILKYLSSQKTKICTAMASVVLSSLKDSNAFDSADLGEFNNQFVCQVPDLPRHVVAWKSVRGLFG